MSATLWTKAYETRRSFIGGSDARIIMGGDEAALLRLWREKRGEAVPEDLSGNLVVLRGGRRRKVHGSGPAQHVGHLLAELSALDHPPIAPLDAIPMDVWQLVTFRRKIDVLAEWSMARRKTKPAGDDRRGLCWA